jgi:hypothetical protein
MPVLNNQVVENKLARNEIEKYFFKPNNFLNKIIKKLF